MHCLLVCVYFAVIGIATINGGVVGAPGQANNLRAQNGLQAAPGVQLGNAAASGKAIQPPPVSVASEINDQSPSTNNGQPTKGSVGVANKNDGSLGKAAPIGKKGDAQQAQSESTNNIQPPIRLSVSGSNAIQSNRVQLQAAVRLGKR